MDPLLVSGFGTSINVEKRNLIIQNKLKNEKLEFYPHQIDHDSIIVDGHTGTITFESMRWLMKHDINLTLLNWNGNLLGITLPQEPKLGKLRIKQYQKHLDDAARFQIALELVNSKISSSVNLIRELSRFYDVIQYNLVKSQFDHEIQNYAINSRDENRPISDKLKKLMNFEGRIAQIHLDQFKKLVTKLAPEFKFVGRMNKSSSWNVNASDEVNALLNYGYAILESRVRKSLNSVGLDPVIGFLHETTYAKTALVYDFQELFRWIIDYSVIRLLDDSKLKKSDFIVTENYHIRLRETTAKLLIEKIKNNFNTKVPFRGKNYTYDNVLFYKIQEFANFISEKSNKLDLKITEFKIKDDDTISLKEKILKMTPDQRKKLGINKSTLWYVKKNIVEGKNIKIYDKILSKIQ
ncbi:CRISPR-associated endonuclease Cas1 [Nitrosotalea sinensis]|uniref:CRISPR-associated endonuclease Cas1 n=1 Tax=Nitrosotalea sinensis TaxID=1499975 RepID=A0A2H1EIL8_9ARCH|nr:CRISPR-associated endonuclease Cas1 [Candidatus Nitrosotalea sinensis]SHO47630.1 CRISPR-associated endonuclease Cas1 [Candidatus Nitrosotalea sinensis]